MKIFYGWIIVGLAAVAIASTFRPPGHLALAAASPSLAR